MRLDLSTVFVAALATGAFAIPTPTSPIPAAPSPSLCTPEQLEQRGLDARAGVIHPSAKSPVTLFHGTSPESAAGIVASGINLSRGVATGDFHHRPEVPGGFYLTDSVIVAAQFACYGSAKRPATVEILQYRWNPAGFSVYEFPGETADWKNFQIYNSFPNLVVNENSPYRPLARTIYANSMITGPLDGPADVFITNAAWQYAVVNQNAANSLALQAQHPGILCKNVPQGNRVDSNLYAQGQAGNAKFSTRVAHLKDPNYSPGNGQFKCSIL